MTAGLPGRVAIAALIAVVVFAAAFALRRASTGTAHAAPLPVPAVISATPVHASGVALPAATLPALHRPPRPSAPAQSTAPSPTPSPSPTPTPTAPAAPAPSGGGGGVLIG